MSDCWGCGNPLPRRGDCRSCFPRRDPSVKRCECTWKWHEGKPCPSEAADHGSVRTSPELCLRCLHVCCGEEDDEMDPLAAQPEAGER